MPLQPFGVHEALARQMLSRPERRARDAGVHEGKAVETQLACFCCKLWVQDIRRNSAQVLCGPARYGGFCKRCSAGGEQQDCEEREAAELRHGRGVFGLLVVGEDSVKSWNAGRVFCGAGLNTMVLYEWQIYDTGERLKDYNEEEASLVGLRERNSAIRGGRDSAFAKTLSESPIFTYFNE